MDRRVHCSRSAPARCLRLRHAGDERHRGAVPRAGRPAAADPERAAASGRDRDPGRAAHGRGRRAGPRRRSAARADDRLPGGDRLGPRGAFRPSEGIVVAPPTEEELPKLRRLRLRRRAVRKRSRRSARVSGHRARGGRRTAPCWSRPWSGRTATVKDTKVVKSIAMLDARRQRCRQAVGVQARALEQQAGRSVGGRAGQSSRSTRVPPARSRRPERRRAAAAPRAPRPAPGSRRARARRFDPLRREIPSLRRPPPCPCPRSPKESLMDSTLPVDAMPAPAAEPSDVAVRARRGHLHATRGGVGGLREHAQWWFPVLIVLVVAASTAGILHNRAIVPMVEDQWQDAVSNGQMPPEQEGQARGLLRQPRRARHLDRADGASFVAPDSVRRRRRGVVRSGLRAGQEVRLPIVARGRVVGRARHHSRAGADDRDRVVQARPCAGCMPVSASCSPTRTPRPGCTRFWASCWMRSGRLSIWYVAILIIGAATLSGAPKRSTAWVIGGLYLALSVFSSRRSAPWSRRRHEPLKPFPTDRVQMLRACPVTGHVSHGGLSMPRGCSVGCGVPRRW